MPSPKHLAVIAAAGSHKTEFVVTQALAATEQRVLITTYTNENLACIQQRIESKVGRVPSHITVMSWYQFLLNQWCRPYQRALLTKPGTIRGVDFQSTRKLYIPQKQARRYFANRRGDLYSDLVADFAFKINDASGGAAVQRIGKIWDQIYIDEVQDLVGYDLNVLDALLKSQTQVTMVGDPRQHTFATNQGPKNKKYRGDGFMLWLDERKALCQLQSRTVSHRCNQAICDLADGLYPHLPPTRSANGETGDPTGIFRLLPSEVEAYVAACHPVVLRWSKTSGTRGLAAINFGRAKGSTHDHVLIFPTNQMRHYIRTGDGAQLSPGARSKLYVAITRARHSVAIVMTENDHAGSWRQ